MTRAYIVMTAMPPTRGHLRLIEFAEKLTDHVELILCTQPDEPYIAQRVQALTDATRSMRVTVHHFDKTIPQVPEDDPRGFWDMWKSILQGYTMTQDDIIVASETYGIKLAETMGVPFYPYDLRRELCGARATLVRNGIREAFDFMIDQFARLITMNITILGDDCEAFGKGLAQTLNGHWVFEYSRAYQEVMKGRENEETFARIWKGQKALGEQAQDFKAKPFIIKEADLYSLIKRESERGGKVSDERLREALLGRSELYLINASSREEEDHWAKFCSAHQLQFETIKGVSLETRIAEGADRALDIFDRTRAFNYQRRGQ